MFLCATMLGIFVMLNPVCDLSVGVVCKVLHAYI